MEYFFISAIFAYLLGSISPSVLMGKYIYKRDPRAYGSKNPGTANSVYVYGFIGGAVVLLIDIMKGFTALWIIEIFFSPEVVDPFLLLLVTAFFVVLGHCLSIFLKFKGGKGFATFCGVSIYLFPKSSLILFFVFIIILLISKYISIATFTVVILSPLIQIYKQFQNQTYSIWSWVVLTAISLLVIYEHRKNVIKLIQGKELTIKTPRISEDELNTKG